MKRARAALVKLVVWDWPALGLVTRLALLLIVGTTLLASPLLSRGRAGEGRVPSPVSSATSR